MRNPWLLLVSLAALLGNVLSLSAATPVTYLGTSPLTAGQPPMPASEISSFGIDADNNRYFLDSANGTVLRVASDGTRSTILSGLKPRNTQTSLVVDYRGNLFVADPGNSRIVSLPAGSATPITRATSSAHSLAVDTTGNCFYLSGSQLYRIPPVGDPRPVGSFPGAALIAYGPASSNPALAEDDTIYVLGSPTAAHAYTVSTFTYHNSAGTIAVDRTFTSTDPVSSFVVDSNRNLILSTTAASTGSLVQIAPSGKATPVHNHPRRRRPLPRPRLQPHPLLP